MKDRQPDENFVRIAIKPSKRIAYLGVCAIATMWLAVGGPWAWREAHDVWMFALISLIHCMALAVLTGIAFLSGLNVGVHSVEYWRERALLAEKKEETKNP